MSNSNITFVLNRAGVRELLRSPQMQNIIREKAEAKAIACGQGYEASVRVGVNRAYANVYPATKEAYQDNLDNNTLEKVIRS